NNWDLSVLRGSSVVQALQTTYNIDPKRLTAGGRGEYNPVGRNDTDAGKTLNRRTQIIITPKLDQFMELINKAPQTDSTGVKHRCSFSEPLSAIKHFTTAFARK